jgi:WhiB family redox-sensing transcriptional regulator
VTGLSWMDRAACKGLPVGAFFSPNGSVTPQARAACNACGVRAECLGYALENDDRFGVWGGLSEAERRRVRRNGQRRALEAARGSGAA